MRRELRPVRAEHEDPEIPAAVSAKDLPFGARVELKTLTKENAEFVAEHLAMVALLIDTDPERAHQHALSASRRGGRIAMVRETLAITAYQTGDFALALRELRTYRRISGSDDQLALMIDSERGLGRPDRALELGRSVDHSKLPAQERVNVAIAMSGARLDQGQPELALAELEIEQLDERRAFEYSPALFSAHAEVLRELGREAEAAKWDALSRRAAGALDAASRDEHETIEVISEKLEGEELAAYIEEHGPLTDEVEAAPDDAHVDAPATPAADTAEVTSEAGSEAVDAAPAQEVSEVASEASSDVADAAPVPGVPEAAPQTGSTAVGAAAPRVTSDARTTTEPEATDDTAPAGAVALREAADSEEGATPDDASGPKTSKDAESEDLGPTLFDL